MATPKAQRIGIWVIAIVLTVGTLGSFLVMGLSINNQKIDQAAALKQYEEQMSQQKAAQQTNADNSEGFGGYTSRVFDKNVTKLNVEVIKQGDGAVVAASDSINSSYFGWLPDGTIFDSSKKKGAEDSPITFSLGQVISGWTEGLAGVKVGSVVRLTIPSDKGYGAQGSGVIPANSPLEFIVEIHSIDNGTKTEA